MCSSKPRLQRSNTMPANQTFLSQIDGRPVLQPTCNRVPLLERRTTLKKATAIQTPPPSNRAINTKIVTPPISPKLKSPRPLAVKRSGQDPNGLNSSGEKVAVTPRSSAAKPLVAPVKKSKKCGAPPPVDTSSLKLPSLVTVESPGSIAAARREQVANMQVQRKMKIAHYGRSKSAKFESKVVPLDSSPPSTTTTVAEEKRCSFITSNSDPIYVAYHDQEWGVPLHDDNLMFEMLVLTGAQVGSDWTSVLKKRQAFRDAFTEFDPEAVSKFSEKKISSVSSDYAIELSLVRGIVDNAKRILEIKKEFGSFDKYLWGFVNNKPIATQYKSGHKIPVKTSKSEAMSKDMVRRGFRLVGPTVMHSFMQAAGLTNDHLTTCSRHLRCVDLASPSDQLPTI